MIARIHRVAERRLGLITRVELMRLGVSDTQIWNLVRTGVLVRIHRGVYRVAGSPTTAEQIALGACLAVGAKAFVSHRTGLSLWALIEHVEDEPQITVPRGRRSQRPGIIVHRATYLGPRDVTHLGLIPVTTVARTLSDAALQIGRLRAERAVDEALRRRVVPPEQLLRDLAGGKGMMKQLADDRLAHGAPESELERRALVLLRRCALPEPVRQHEVAVNGRRYRLDLAYPAHRLAVELNGRAPHWGRERWESDHYRRRDLRSAGWSLLEFTWADITEGAAKFGLEVGAALGLSPVRWR